MNEFVSPAAVSFFFLFFKKNCMFVTIFASALKKHVHNNNDNDNDDNTN